MGQVSLIHRRLAIIDPAGGHQPYIDGDGSIGLTYNGEVYNYVELARELGRPNLICDTHVITAAYEKWGIACVERFRGMFAFALYDSRIGKLFLVRDRLGIKPLFHARRGNSVVFGSEIHALVASGLIDLQPDREAVSLFLRDGYVRAPLTAFSGIEKLPPATIREIDVATGQHREWRYWSAHSAAKTARREASVENLECLLGEITDLYVRADVPFGAFLSGGIDSGIVSAFMAERLRIPVRAFTIDFDEKSHSEGNAARLTAAAIDAEHVMRTLTPDSSIEMMSEIAFRFAEPFADSSALPTRLVSQLAAQDVKMVLSGDGGDEVFGGYASYASVLTRSEQSPSIGEKLGSLIGKRLRASSLGSGLTWRGADWQESQRLQRDYFTFFERRALMPGTAMGNPSDFSALVDPVLACQLDDLAGYLPEDILTKVDRMSMAESLEVRVPLLDHKLIEFAMALPLTQRLAQTKNGVISKVLLRQAARKRLPTEIVDRPKMGFGIPIVDWTLGPLRQLVDELATHPTAIAHLVEPREVRRTVRRYLAGDRSLVAKVWSLISLRLWVDAIPRIQALAR